MERRTNLLFLIYLFFLIIITSNLYTLFKPSSLKTEPQFHSENASFFPFVHTTTCTREKVKNASMTCELIWICVGGKLGLSRKSHDCRDTRRFRKAPFSKCFPSTRKRIAGVFKFLRFKRVFGKLRYCDGLVLVWRKAQP